MGIHQEVRFKAPPAKIYAALTSGKEFGQLTGAPAEVTAVEGQPISLFGGQITGRNIELIADKSVVQAWRVGAWPPGVYSIVRFTLENDGGETRLTLDHTGYPDGAEGHLEAGWHKMYWEPLRSFVE